MSFHYISNKKQLVISRCYEKIDWIEKVSFFFDDIVVYDKNDDGNAFSSELCKVATLPNLGRECHSFLTHIVSNYENITKYSHISFLQADPLEHSPDFVKILMDNKNHGYKPFFFVKNNINKLSYNYEPIEKVHPIGLPLFSFYYHLFCDKIVDNISQSRNSMMIVPSKKIVFRSKKFYQYLLEYLEKSNNPLEGYIIERLWIPIFDGETKDWITHYEVFRSKFLGIWNNNMIT